MSKTSYTIRTSINRSKLDHEINLEGGGMSFPSVSLKVVLYWIAVILVLVWAITSSPISRSPIWLRVAFLIWLLLSAVYFGKLSKTKEMKFSMLPAMISYLPKANRRVLTRRSSNPFPFMEIAGVKDIEPNGLIHYIDGSVGQAYAVVGTASKLLFDGDRTRIINSVDRFFRKIDTNAEWNFLTTKEPQRVYRQIANTERQNRNLRPENYHPELYALMQEKHRVLRDDVGDKYYSIHQYLVIRAKNMADLNHAHTLLEAEVMKSSNMFKQCTILDAQSTIEMLRSVYRNDVKDQAQSALA